MDNSLHPIQTRRLLGNEWVGEGGLLQKKAKQHVEHTTASGRVITHQQSEDKHRPVPSSTTFIPAAVIADGITESTLEVTHTVEFEFVNFISCQYQGYQVIFIEEQL